MSMSTVVLNSWVEDVYSQLFVGQIAAMMDKEDAFYSRLDYLGELPESDGDLIKGQRGLEAEGGSVSSMVEKFSLRASVINYLYLQTLISNLI